MRKWKQMTGGMMAAMMTASLLTGCSSPTEQAPATTAAPAADTAAAEKETETEASGEEVTLRMSWWGGDSRHERLLALIDEFEKENPGVNIEPEYSAFADYRDKFTMQLTSGAAADIMAVDQPWVSSIISQGEFFVDLSAYDELLDLNGFDPYLMDNFCKFDQGTIFLPAGVNGMGSLVDTENETGSGSGTGRVRKYRCDQSGRKTV